MTGSEGGDRADPTPVFKAAVADGVCRLRRPGTRWLSTGHDGGGSRAEAAYLVSVPDGWDEVDVAGYVRDRLDAAGFGGSGPALLTGVAMRHAHRARRGPVEAVVTAGVNNPAALPMPGDEPASTAVGPPEEADGHRHAGTVNVVVGTTRSLAPGALANLVAVAAEAKAATLLEEVSVPGTTSDAVVVGCDPAGEEAAFSGSATPVGAAARICVRDALAAALSSRYASGSPPESVADAAYGVVSDGRAEVERVVSPE
jgi:adenosylcobinamide hydrolase